MSKINKNEEFNRELLESVLKRRFFFAPSFDIYGGVSGLYDYGPPGCSLQSNFIDLWRKHFVIEEDMLEVDTTMLTPYEVLKTSGHVDKFTDWMCRDIITGEIFRADHLIEEVLESRLKGDREARGTINTFNNNDNEKDKKRKKKVKEIKAIKLDDNLINEYSSVLAKIDSYTGVQFGELIEKFNITNPSTGNKLTTPIEFNLMFETAIGPSGQLKGYLRPETAQGQFLNFNKLLEFNNLKMPFASASIGKSFRNEISPRAGLLRVREFLMAEIEHYVDPQNKNHPRFNEISNIKLKLLPKQTQESGKTDLTTISIADAVNSHMIDNQTLGYFLARIYLFLIKIGINPNRLRFRQHMSNEMAHYASDCWDAELQTSYGWIECVGCADRSAYDLSVHSARTNEKLVVRQKRDTPIEIEVFDVEIDKKKFGPLFRKNSAAVEDFLLSRTECEKEALAKELNQNGKISINIENIPESPFEVDSSLVKIQKVKKTEHIREFVPNVIEPSFGIGRIIYSLIEQSFWTRPGDEARAVFSFPPSIAPFKVLLVPLSSNKEFTPLIDDLTVQLRKLRIPSKVDDSSASIGKRYARNDELGTPFGITVDFQSVKDGSITLRERDSTTQVRGSKEEIFEAIRAQIFDGKSWSEATKNLSVFESQQE